MKVRYDNGDHGLEIVEVPPELIANLRKYWDCDDDCEICQKEYVRNCITDFIGAAEGGLDEFYPDKIYPKEIADFIVGHDCYTYRGYFVEERLAVETPGETVVVIAYGTLPDSADEVEYWTPNLIAYRTSQPTSRGGTAPGRSLDEQ